MTTSKPIRWLHLSDFHVGKDDYAGRKMFDYILAHVRKREADGFVPDLLFLTGDLANKGLVGEYETFWQEFIWPLQEEIGDGIKDRTFAVPGNHDVDRTEHQAFSREDMASATSHYLDPSEEGEKLRKMLRPRFSPYLDNDCTPTKGAFSGPDGAFAQTIEMQGNQVGIVGINTAWLSKDEHDERQLSPGKPLLEKALNAIDSAKLCIVLGHHPIDWFIPAQQKAIKSLLGQHHVLYLHGHLHAAWAEPSYGGGHTFLAIQSGACFQAREGEIWRNGLVWGEADLDTGEVRLQPWRWIPDHQAWTPATDAFHENHRRGEWWHYALPGTQPVPNTRSPVTPEVQPPRGWPVAKADDLNQHCAPLTPEAALRFFDGAVPDWSTALSTSIPRRKIVARLVGHFRDAETAESPIVTLLLAASCEGKTTALLQAAHAVVKGREDWRILQRRDEAQALVTDDLLPVLNKDFNWLLLLDEADRIASDLQAFIKRLPRELHGRVHCLLACRDSDWLASGADTLKWSDAVSFHLERLTGLDQADAQAIVSAWQAFGDMGLGDLTRLPENQRASALEKQAKEEAKTATGAFFGALLAVRSGADLRNHARLLLERIGQRKIRSGGTLRDALAFIAAMHAEGLEFLSRPVLAQALGCPLGKLHRDVLVPLGQEAAATTTSSFIFTRHRRIAETLVSVLEQEFGEDIGGLYVTLGQSAVDAFKSGAYVLELGGWRFKLSDHFFVKGQRELAINIARAVLSREPDNSLTRTHVANLYRKASVPEQAAQVFREAPGSVQNGRGFYFEWAVAEGECGHQAASALLAAYALSDQCPAPPVDNEHARMTLAGMGVSLGKLYAAYNNRDFRDARMAVATLGQTLPFNLTAVHYSQRHADEATAQGAVQPNLEQAFDWFHAGVIAAAKIGVDATVAALLPKADEFVFAGLRRLIMYSAQSKRH